MECFCGCGRTIKGRRVESSTKAAEVAVELLAWDKARAAGHLRGSAATEDLIERGADRYRDLIATVHDPASGDHLEVAGQWLRESERERHDRPYMVRKAGLIGRDKLLLDPLDYERLDRRRPERSFSAGVTEADGFVDELGRLAELHRDGSLTSVEFMRAKERLLASRGDGDGTRNENGSAGGLQSR